MLKNRFHKKPKVSPTTSIANLTITLAFNYKNRETKNTLNITSVAVTVYGYMALSTKR